MITIPKISAIADQIITGIEAKIGQTIPSAPKAFFRVLAYALAGVLALVYRYGAWVYLQIFPGTADLESLRRIGEQYGITQLPATAAEFTAIASGVNGTEIPAGELWQLGNQVYTQTALVTISGGLASISLLALVAGEAGTPAVGAEISIITPRAGVDEIATVDAVATTGEDAESTEDYRSRILTRTRQKPQGGSVADYVIWAREVPGIVKAFAFRTAPLEVTVYPLLDAPDRIPGAPKLSEVEAYLQDTIRRPLCANVYAQAMTERVVNLTVTDLQPDTTQTRNAIEAALEAYLLTRYPKQYTDEADPTDQLVRSLLIAESLDAGARVIEADMYLDAEVSPTIYYTLANDEIAKLGTITWPS